MQPASLSPCLPISCWWLHWQAHLELGAGTSGCGLKRSVPGHPEERGVLRGCIAGKQIIGARSAPVCYAHTVLSNSTYVTWSQTEPSWLMTSLSKCMAVIMAYQQQRACQMRPWCPPTPHLPPVLPPHIPGPTHLHPSPEYRAGLVVRA